MPDVGEQADVLRALGRFLDDEAATGIEITSLEFSLAVSWDTGLGRNEQRMYQEHDLEALRAQARALRQDLGNSVAEGSLGDMLRTLGQLLDRERSELVTVVQEAGGFRVSSIGDGRYHTRLYDFLDLIDVSAEHRAERAAVTQPEAERVDLTAEITLGVPIFTRDNQRLGKVGEVRYGALCVETSFIQRDFWLPGACVASAGNGLPVLLAITKAELEQHKLEDEPTKPVD